MPPIVVKSQVRDPLVPTEIRFVPIRSKGQVARVKAIAVRLNGAEEVATSAQISLVTGKQFFDNDTTRIPRERLQLWLDGLITDHEAATECLDQLRLLAQYRNLIQRREACHSA